MGRGLRRTAFDQASYDYWTGQYGVVNVKDFGAVGDGVHDDTQAIQQAINSMGTDGDLLSGTLIFPSGLYRISKTINIDGGNVVGNSSTVYENSNNIHVIMYGSLLPDSNIGDALFVHRIINGTFDLRVHGGGTDADRFLHLEDTFNANINCYALQYAGTVLYHDNQTKSGGYAIHIENLIAYRCGQAFNLSGTKAFGQFSNVWDINPKSGSILDSMYDVSILHYENSVNTTPANNASLVISNSGSIHLGIIALGGSGTCTDGFLNLNNNNFDAVSTGVHIDQALIVGNSDSIGIYSYNSGLSIASAHTIGCKQALEVDQGVVTIDAHRDYNSLHALSLGAMVSGAGQIVTVKSAYYNSEGGSAIDVASNIGSSELSLSDIRVVNNNTTGTSGVATLSIASSNARLTLRNIVDINPNASSAYSLSCVNYSQIANPHELDSNSWARGVNYSSKGPYTTLAGETAGNIYWIQPEQGPRKVFIAYFDGYENDTTTNQTITFPTAYSYTPTVATNSTNLTVSASTTELTITSPDSTSTYSGVVEVVGL